MDQKKTTKNLSTFVRFTGLGLQMGLTIWVASLIGDWLDENYPSDYISYFKVITLFAVFGSVYSIIRQVIRFGKQQEERQKREKQQSSND